MRPTLILLKKELRLFFKDKVAIGLTFIVPIVLIYILGSIFGNMGDDSTPQSGIPIAVLDQVDSEASHQILNALKSEKGFKVIEDAPGPDNTRVPLNEQRIREDIHNNRYRFALVIPSDSFTASAIGIRLKLMDNPVDPIETQIVQGLLQKNLFMNLPVILVDQLAENIDRMGEELDYQDYSRDMATVISAYFDVSQEEIQDQMSIETLKREATKMIDAGIDTPDKQTGDDSEDSQNIFEQVLEIERDQVIGKEIKNPQVTRTIGGYAIMFLMFAVTASSNSLFDEKRSGIFNRLLSLPMQRTHVLWSKCLFNTMLGLLQILTLYIAGSLMFGIDIQSNFANLIIVAACAASACTAFGMFVASISKTQAQAQGLATFIILLMASVGGAWWPITIMPSFMQFIAKFTLVYWAVEGMTVTLWNQASLTQLLPYIGVLIGITAIVSAFSVWKFKRGSLMQ